MMEDVMDEAELVRKFDSMVEKESKEMEPMSVFDGWSDDDKIFFMKQLRVSLSEHTEAPNLGQMDVPDSVVFDITSDENAYSNYISSIGHYRSWQYVGSDKRYQFGSDRKRVFVTRSSGVFVFYYRYQNLVVGLVVDGQTGWVEGAITRDLIHDREVVLQFRRISLMSTDYIRSPRTHTLKYDGNYTKAGKTYEAKLGSWPIRNAVKAIASYTPGVTKSEPDPIHWQILILFSTEAGRLNHVFCCTSESLSFDKGPYAISKLHPGGEQFIQKYLKLSFCAIETIEGRPFVLVKGTSPRNLYQIVLEILILRRLKVHPTCFHLPDALPVKYNRNEPHQGKGPLTREETLEIENATGTRYLAGKHDGTIVYNSEEWLIKPFKEVTQPKIIVPREFHHIQKLDLTEVENVAQLRVASTTTISLERLVCDQWYQEGHYQKKDRSAIGGRSFSMPESGLAARTSNASTKELRWHDKPRLPMVLGTDNEEVRKITKKHGIARETNSMNVQNKRIKLMVAEHEERSHANSETTHGDLFHESSGSNASDGHADSRTVLVTNDVVTTKEELYMNFMKWDPVLEINRDAHANFAEESAERAKSLTRRPFFSRLPTVARKAGAPARGFLPTSGGSCSHPRKKGASPLPAAGCPA